MNIKLILVAFITSLFFAGCDKCDGVACSTGPPSFSVMLLDKETGENVFASGKYKENQVSVEDSEGNSVYSLGVGEDDYFIIRVSL